MTTAHEITRMTIDFPKKEHQKLKALAAMMGISLRQLVLNFVHSGVEKLKIPNKTTLAAMKEADEGKNLTSYKNIDSMLEDLGLPHA